MCRLLSRLRAATAPFCLLVLLTACGGGSGGEADTSGGDGDTGGTDGTPSIPPNSKGAVDVLFVVETSAAGEDEVTQFKARFLEFHPAITAAGYDAMYAIGGVNSIRGFGSGLLRDGNALSAPGGELESLQVDAGSAPVQLGGLTAIVDSIPWRDGARRIAVLVRDLQELGSPLQQQAQFAVAEDRLRRNNVALAMLHRGSLHNYEDLLKLFTFTNGSDTDTGIAGRSAAAASMDDADLAAQLVAALDAHNGGPHSSVGLSRWGRDDDADLFIDDTNLVDSFFQPMGRILGNGIDCDDSDPNVFPGATEIMGNGIDDDCNGLVDG